MINTIFGFTVIGFILTTAILLSTNVSTADYSLDDDIFLNSKKGNLLSLATSLHALLFQIEKISIQLKDRKDQKTAQKTMIMVKTAEKYKKGYESLTGMEYQGHDTFLHWWEQNEPYLYWSEGKKMLLVDEEAKKEKRILHVYSKSIPITTDIYWRHFARGTITEFLDFDGLNIHVRIKGLGRARANKSTLENRKIKQREFRSAAGYIIRKMKGNRDNTEEIELLKNITDQQFDDYDSWVVWWNKNRLDLVLNKEGTKLVVRGK